MLKRIYDSLIDDKSRKIYTSRLLNYITGDKKYYIDIIRSNDYKKTDCITLSDYYKNLMAGTHDEAVIWGAGSSGELRYKFNLDTGYDNIKYFVDSNVEMQKRGCNGKRVLSPEEFFSVYDNELIIIESLYYEDEIKRIIKENLNDKCRIVNHFEVKTQYFDEKFVFSDDEVFLDCGCFDCSTIKDFIKATNGKYNKIIAFEPDKQNYEECLKIAYNDKLKNVEIINKGLWNKETTINFAANNKTRSCIVEDDNLEERIFEVDTTALDEVHVTKIDDVLKDEKVTFIKMDIEGSELKALKGAENTIKKNKPKLAISIYHKPEDIVEIPKYLKTIVPEYKFMIRHYTELFHETVLYACVEW